MGAYVTLRLFLRGYCFPVGDVCQKFCKVCVSEGRATEALLPLRTAAKRMSVAQSTLTLIHPEFLQVGLMTLILR